MFARVQYAHAPLPIYYTPEIPFFQVFIWIVHFNVTIIIILIVCFAQLTEKFIVHFAFLRFRIEISAILWYNNKSTTEIYEKAEFL